MDRAGSPQKRRPRFPVLELLGLNSSALVTRPAIMPGTAAVSREARRSPLLLAHSISMAMLNSHKISL